MIRIFIFLFAVIVSGKAFSCAVKDHKQVALDYLRKVSEKGSSIELNPVGNQFRYSVQFRNKNYSVNEDGTLEVKSTKDGKCQVSILSSQTQSQSR